MNFPFLLERMKFVQKQKNILLRSRKLNNVIKIISNKALKKYFLRYKEKILVEKVRNKIYEKRKMNNICTLKDSFNISSDINNNENVPDMKDIKKKQKRGENPIVKNNKKTDVYYKSSKTNPFNKPVKITKIAGTVNNKLVKPLLSLKKIVTNKINKENKNHAELLKRYFTFWMVLIKPNILLHIKSEDIIALKKLKFKKEYFARRGKTNKKRENSSSSKKHLKVKFKKGNSSQNGQSTSRSKNKSLARDSSNSAKKMKITRAVVDPYNTPIKMKEIMNMKLKFSDHQEIRNRYIISKLATIIGITEKKSLAKCYFFWKKKSKK